MNKVKKYIKKRNSRIIDKLAAQIYCKHKWKEHGYGYMCRKCDYYSGRGNDLNELIETK